jgi:hypothetical protein
MASAHITPQAMTSFDDHSAAWSAAWGAMVGAGSVLLIAAVLLLWKKPRKRTLPLLAPMDIGQNVSTIIFLITTKIQYVFLKIFDFKHFRTLNKN